jgi:hypothetical protein
VALLSLLLNTARIKEPRAANDQARRTGPTSGCPVKIEEPVKWALPMGAGSAKAVPGIAVPEMANSISAAPPAMVAARRRAVAYLVT